MVSWRVMGSIPSEGTCVLSQQPPTGPGNAGENHPTASWLTGHPEQALSACWLVCVERRRRDVSSYGKLRRKFPGVMGRRVQREFWDSLGISPKARRLRGSSKLNGARVESGRRWIDRDPLKVSPEVIGSCTQKEQIGHLLAYKLPNFRRTG